VYEADSICLKWPRYSSADIEFFQWPVAMARPVIATNIPEKIQYFKLTSALIGRKPSTPGGRETGYPAAGANPQRVKR